MTTPPSDPLVIGLPIPDRMAPAYAYFAAAAALGYDRVEGLRFTFLYGGTPLLTAEALAAGRCRFAPLNMAIGFLANERGWPLRAVYSSSRRAHRWFAVPPGSTIRTLADFRGKHIACDFADLEPLARSALAEDGVDPGSVHFVPWRGSGMAVGDMIEPIRSGTVDGVFLIDWNHGDFIAEGLPMRRIPSKLMDSAELSSCLWTMPETARAAGALIARVGRALAKATLFAIENPAAVIRLMWAHHPDTAPREADRDRALRRGIAILRARTDTMRPEGTEDPRWGAMLAHEFAAANAHLIRSGTIRIRHEPASLFTSDHIDAFNAFDAAAIRRDAREAG
jgi:NitT/TauT family transport system substrate-binding protein